MKVTKSKLSDQLNCVLVNYANKYFTQSQQVNTKTGIRLGKFKEVWSFSPRDIPNPFYLANKELLNQKKENGYWLWKPYFILKSSEKLDFGEYLFYCDSGAEFVDSIEPLLKISIEKSLDILSFEVVHSEYKYTKREALVLMDCDFDYHINSRQRLSGYILFKKSDFVLKFLNEWLQYNSNARIVTDHVDEVKFPNYHGFVNHRHDQSIFSLLTKKYDFEAYRDPSQ